MKSWTYAANQQKGSIIVVEQPLWLSIVEWGIESIIHPMIHSFEWLTLPSFIKIIVDDEQMAWKEYWGSVSDYLCCRIYIRLLNWYFNHPSRKETMIEIGYEKLKQLFVDSDPNFFAEIEDNT